jgi:hypothetical protein
LASRDSEIQLTAEQEDLLRWLVRRSTELPAEKRNFTAAVSPSGDFIEMGAERRAILYSDLEELKDKGLVRYTERPQMGAGTRPVAERGAVTAKGLAYAEGSRIGQPAPSPDVLLTDEQKELLVLLVEETRRLPKDKRQEFLAVRSLSGDHIVSGTQERRQVFIPDVEELAHKGLVRLQRESNFEFLFVVSPEGFQFYETLKRQQRQPVERVEAETRHLLERDLMDAYPEAVGKWREAEDLLWTPDADQQLTSIGHKCREALQAFAQRLYEELCPGGEALPKEKTVNKVAAILETKKDAVGGSTRKFLAAYWEMVNDLGERAEHGSQREGSPLLWDDGRRLVFQTLSVMVELKAALSA